MTVQDRRERERQEMRRKIMNAARELLSSRCYDNVTMRGIAESIDYSPTAIYYHFKDKDDLVLALCEEDFSRLLDYFGSQEPPHDPVDAVRQIGRAYARFGLEHPNHYRFLFMTPSHALKPECGEPRGPAAGERAYMALRTLVERAIVGGHFRPAPVDTAAQVLWAAVHGAVALLITVPPDHFPCAPAASDLADQVIETNIRGLLAVGPHKPARPRKGGR